MLIKCPECKKEVSDTAETCVHCGHPLPKTNWNMIIAFFVFLFVGSIVLGIGAAPEPSSEPLVRRVLRIEKDYVNCRDKPNGRVIDNRLLDGDTFPYFGNKDGWSKIAIDGRYGYVSDKVKTSTEPIQYSAIRHFLGEVSKIDKNCPRLKWENDETWKNSQYNRKEWCHCYALIVAELAIHRWKIMDEDLPRWHELATIKCDERQDEKYVVLCEDWIKANIQKPQSYQHDIMGYWNIERIDNNNKVQAKVWFKAKDKVGKLAKYEGVCIFNDKEELVSSDIHIDKE